MTVGCEFFYGSKCLWVSQSKPFDVWRRKMDVSLDMLVDDTAHGYCVGSQHRRPRGVPGILHFTIEVQPGSKVDTIALSRDDGQGEFGRDIRNVFGMTARMWFLPLLPELFRTL